MSSLQACTKETSLATGSLLRILGLGKGPENNFTKKKPHQLEQLMWLFKQRNLNED
jgi:hypothetical protein